MGAVAQNEVAIVGIGSTPFFRRGESLPLTMNEMIGQAILNACADAGISAHDIDGFAYFAHGIAGNGAKMDTALLIETLGMRNLNFAASMVGGGGGSCGAIGLAALALSAGEAKYVVTVMGLQQDKRRLGAIYTSNPPTPESAFYQPSGMAGTGHYMGMMARRHMHLYGTRREAYAEVVLSQRQNALNRPTAMLRTPLTLDDYWASPMLADPLCRLDFCMDSDGAVAVITTAADRARDLKQKPAYVRATASGGPQEWGRGYLYLGMPDPLFASSGHRYSAAKLYERAGLTAADIDVALLYDHFSPLVVTQLEDFGFCGIGEGGPFVESGAIRYLGGSIPVNTNGGQLSEAYIVGMTHITEAVEQIRGVAINQVADAEFALVTGGPGPIPMSSLILGRSQ